VTTQALAWPPPLVAGDQVAVVACSSPARRPEFSAGLTLLRSWGLDPVVIGDPFARATAPRDYLAGEDTARAQAWAEALGDERLRAVFCARGGYGAMRALEALGRRRDLDPATPRWIVGASDITALHLELAQRSVTGLVYGPMPATRFFATAAGLAAQGESPDDHGEETLRRLLMGEIRELRMTGRCVIAGAARGELSGGCLSLVAALAGAPGRMQARGRIVFLEDTGETAYRLDRLLTSLRMAGALEAVSGVAIGSLEGAGLEAPQIDALLRDRLGDLGVPVVAGLHFGHGDVQMPVPYLAEGTIEAEDVTGALHWQLPPCG